MCLRGIGIEFFLYLHVILYVLVLIFVCLVIYKKKTEDRLNIKKSKEILSDKYQIHYPQKENSQTKKHQTKTYKIKKEYRNPILIPCTHT